MLLKKQARKLAKMSKKQTFLEACNWRDVCTIHRLHSNAKSTSDWSKSCQSRKQAPVD